jgi:chemotaxis protein MotB
MVEPNRSRRGKRSSRSWAFRAACLATACGTGCGVVPKQRLEDCHQVSQTLRSENNRLKDLTLDLRARNQDLSERAVDDSRRLAMQEQAVDRLEKSVQAYQAEREQMAAALETVKRQVRLAVTPHAAANPARLKAFAAAHPDWSFDPARLTLSAPSAKLFEPGADRLRPAAAEALKALAAELSGPGGDALHLEIAGPPDAPPIAKAGFDPARSDDDAKLAAASARFLAAARAARVRDRLLADAGLDPAHARLAKTAPRAADAPDDPERRVEIRLGIDNPTSVPPALDAAGAGHR